MYNRNLIDYLPENLRTIKEYEAILTLAMQPEMVALWEAVDNMLNDQFIDDATENGVSRREKIMKIVPKSNETLDARKFTIHTKNNQQPPFSIRVLEKQLEALCGEDGYEVTRDVANKILTVRVALTAESNFADVADLLERVVPADMVIDLSLKYNQHYKFATFTHEQLQNFTHEQLRNEVF